MQKSFLLVFGAFIIAAFLFIFGGQDVTTSEVVTTFEISDSGIAVNNGLTGEHFIIPNDEIIQADKTLNDITPAAGEDIKNKIDDFDLVQTDIMEEDIGADLDTLLAIEDDVTKIIERK